MKTKVILVASAVVVVSVALLLMRGGESGEINDGDDHPMPNSEHSGGMSAGARTGKLSKAREKIDAAIGTIKNKSVRPRRSIGQRSSDIESTWVDEDGNPWPKEQRALMRDVIEAADNADVDGLAFLAKDVLKCQNAELRENFVEEVGWFGEKAFEVLADFISDPSEDVAEAAKTQITDAFRDIENEDEKAALCVLMSHAVSDAEVLESFTDELSSMDEALALQTIVDMIDGGTPNAKAAAESAYEEITEEKWSDIDAAESWLNDNYIDKDTMEKEVEEEDAEDQEF